MVYFLFRKRVKVSAVDSFPPSFSVLYVSILVALEAQYPEKRQLEHVPSVGPALLPLMHFDVDRHHTQNVPSAQLAHDVYGLHTSSYNQQTKALEQSCKAPCKDTGRKTRMNNGGSSDAISTLWFPTSAPSGVAVYLTNIKT